jgi:hypothetical protein
MSRLNRRGLTAVSIIVTVLAAVAAFAAAPTQASGVCPTQYDACIIVNSNADDDVRDQTLTLREAMLLDGGHLALDAITTDERAQVLLNHSDGMQGGLARSVYFDAQTFCDGCSTNRIMLQPPGWGGEGGGFSATALPPGWGGEAEPPGWGGEWFGDSAGLMMTPPGWGGESPSALGMALTATGLERVASVILDGSALPEEYVGLYVANRASWLRGLQFHNFLGTAIGVQSGVADQTVLGTNGDGLNDAGEAVVFTNNGADFVVTD